MNASGITNRSSPVVMSWGVSALILLLVIPRVVRMMHDQIWPEDESYLNCAQLIANGLVPYVDFPLPHFPLLESFLAGCFLLIRDHVTVTEALTQCATLVDAILVCLIGYQLGGKRVAVVAGLLFSTCSLVFHYHLFERELYLMMPILAATILTMKISTGQDGAGHTLLISVLLSVALLIKLTSVIFVLGITLSLFLTGKKRKSVRVLIETVILMTIVTCICVICFGNEFLNQVILFRLIHASFPTLDWKAYLILSNVDISMILGFAGCALILWNGVTWRWIVPIVMLGVAVIAHTWLNPTLWSHNLLDWMPWLALTGGYLIDQLICDLQSCYRVSTGLHQRVGSALSVVAIGFAAFMIFSGKLPVLKNDYGMTYMAREELDAVAAFVGNHSERDQRLIVPPIVAFAAHRMEVVPYPEIAGQVLLLRKAIADEGYLGALSTLRNRRHMSFWDSVATSRNEWLEDVTSLIQEQTTPVVVNYTDHEQSIPLLPYDYADSYLIEHGYELALETKTYKGWLPGTNRTR